MFIYFVLFYYQQDCPKGSSVGIVFTQVPIFRFLPRMQRGHVAPVKVKLQSAHPCQISPSSDQG